MTTSVTEKFALLLGDERPSGTEVLTRRTGVATKHGPALLGIDRDGRRHLLVPVLPSESPKDRISRGVDLDHRELTIGSDVVRFADLSCTISRLNSSFDRLVDDILGRLSSDSAAGLNALVSALDDWRALLRRALDDLSREEVVGLVGELEVLLQLSANDPLAAVQGWTGPAGAIHDFSRHGRDIEVKTTAAVNATSVRISDLDQLDPSLSTALHLAVVHLAAASDAPDIEARIDALLAAGVPGDALEQRLVDVGYVRGMELSIPSRYVVRSVRWWNVDQDFPGLRSGDIDPQRLLGINGVSYDLLLGAVPAAMPSDLAARVLRDWASQPS